MLNIDELLQRNQELAATVFASRADEIDRERRFPRENVQALGRAGLLGLLVPREFGGAGAGIPEMSQTLEPLAQACPSTAMVTLMHHCGTAVIAARGSESLCRKYLPAMARGEHLSTLAFSEAGSGGHFYLPASQVVRNGQGLRLSAHKSFVTSAGEAASYIVSTRKAGAAGPMDSDLFVVPAGTPGLEVQGRFEGLGLAGNASAPMKLQNVPLRDEDRVALALFDSSAREAFQLASLAENRKVMKEAISKLEGKLEKRSAQPQENIKLDYIEGYKRLQSKDFDEAIIKNSRQ